MKTRKRRAESDLDSLHKYSEKTPPEVGPIPYDSYCDIGNNGKYRIIDSLDLSSPDFYPRSDIWDMREKTKL